METADLFQHGRRDVQLVEPERVFNTDNPLAPAGDGAAAPERILERLLVRFGHHGQLAALQKGAGHDVLIGHGKVDLFQETACGDVG